MPKNTTITQKPPVKKAATKPSKASWLRQAKSLSPARCYAFAALLILIASTLFWATLGASLQNDNADQLVDGYLFEDGKTFDGAVFPGQHTQLLKWPLFWLLRLFHYSPASFTVLTVGVVLATIVGLMYVLYRIERRPLVFGTLCLAFASMLLLVPPQPYAGGLLPVNMAMLTTRNLEYLLYIASLVMLARTKRLRSWQFIGAISSLSVLLISDKLFLSLSIGASLLACISYIAVKRWTLAGLASNWFLASVIAATVAAAGLGMLNATGLVHISGQTNTGPYSVTHSLNDMMLGGIYAFGGVFTNAGINPAFDAIQVRDIAPTAWHRLTSGVGIAFVINALLFVGGIVASVRLGAASLRRGKDLPMDVPLRLSIMLLWTSLASLLVFIASKHYYAVDARYLTIVVFSMLVAAATFNRTKHWKSSVLVGCGVTLLVSILAGLSFANNVYQDDKAALAPQQNRNNLIAQALDQHPVEVLVGDYWRVLPIKLAASKRLTVLPLADCTKARDTLTSTAWLPNLHTQSFAYLLSLEPGLTDYPACSIAQVTAIYGRPNASAVVAGNIDKPKELLLFYDHGKQISKTHLIPSTQSSAGTVTPLLLAKLPRVRCEGGGRTIMQVVAHQDDDLLFMNPDLSHAIKAGDCVRTLYITAGDAGSNKFYWLGREQGSEAAYTHMVGMKDVWIQRTVKLANRQYITVANPVGNTAITLMFMHLPDGNITGSGFTAYHYESLARLEAGSVDSMVSVDGQSSYTSDQLRNALVSLMEAYLPDEIHTQSPENMSSEYPDHSDHLAVGSYTMRAYSEYLATHPATSIKYYVGYPIHALTPNVADGDLAEKAAAFFAYSKFDGGTCSSLANCDETGVYGMYLRRQYQTAQP